MDSHFFDGIDENLGMPPSEDNNDEREIPESTPAGPRYPQRIRQPAAVLLSPNTTGFQRTNTNNSKSNPLPPYKVPPLSVSKPYTSSIKQQVEEKKGNRLKERWFEITCRKKDSPELAELAGDANQSPESLAGVVFFAQEHYTGNPSEFSPSLHALLIPALLDAPLG
ncbi:hypothetical protein LXL04_006378 [Taraxacum kok-saghyz]